MRGGPEKDAGRVGERGGDPAEHHMQLAEKLDLARIERMLRRVRTGEMAHQERDPVTGRLETRGESGGLVDRDAEPVHAGVEMERGAAGPSLHAAEGVPLDQFRHAPDHRAQAHRGKMRRAARRDAVEHIDDRVRRDLPHGPRLVNVGDEKRRASGLGERAGSLAQAAAIGVGLHHRGAFRRLHPLGERAPIRSDRVEIDREHAAGLDQRRTADDSGRSRRRGLDLSRRQLAFLHRHAVLKL